MPSLHFVLGITFVVVGVVTACLQAWLWTFPMMPDPTGRDPNGVTTAPSVWRMTHRALGYVFAGIYVWILFAMVPRLWQFEPEAWRVSVVVHAATGVAIFPLLLTKVAILRWHQRHGKKLPWIGGAITLLAIGNLALVAPPYLRAAQGAESRIIRERCFSCHGATVISSEDGDFSDWLDTVEEMREIAADRGRQDPAAGAAEDIARRLAQTLPDD